MKVDRPKKKDFQPVFLDAAELQHLFEVGKGTKLKLPVLVAAFYGLRLPLTCQWRTAQADSRLAGTFGFLHHGKYLRPSGLQFETLLSAGDGERYVTSRSGRFRQQMGAKSRKNRGLKIE